jgi:hypothetical protein
MSTLEVTTITFLPQTAHIASAEANLIARVAVRCHLVLI